MPQEWLHKSSNTNFLWESFKIVTLHWTMLLFPLNKDYQKQTILRLVLMLFWNTQEFLYVGSLLVFALEFTIMSLNSFQTESNSASRFQVRIYFIKVSNWCSKSLLKSWQTLRLLYWCVSEYQDWLMMARQQLARSQWQKLGWQKEPEKWQDLEDKCSAVMVLHMRTM